MCSTNFYEAQNNDNIFALKTFEGQLVPELAEDRFRQEIEANLDAPKHDRIVRLLAAFTYREQLYLVFPLASAGSLESLWKEYIPDGIPQKSTRPRHADWYSDDWLVGECLGIAEAVVATQGLADDCPEGLNGLLHADIKAQNILCFQRFVLDKHSVELKLADFGEAKRLKPNASLKANTVAHVKTYRPPEHYQGKLITLNYDVWCLGCLFLDFVTWAILGHDGIDSFREIRENELDEECVTESPGQLIEDTFFKRVKKTPGSSLRQRLTLGYKSKKTVKPGQATMQHYLWVATHVGISSRLKDGVSLVSDGEFPSCSLPHHVELILFST